MTVSSLDPAAGVAPTRSLLPGWVSFASLAVVGAALCVGVVSVSAAVVTLLAGGAIVVGYADVVWRRIPNVMCAAMLGFTVVVAAISESRWWDVAVGAVLTATPFLVVHLVDPRWVGFGDVKLLFAVGAVLGALAPMAGLLALWLAGVMVSVTRPFVPQAWRRSVPFGFWLSVCAVPVAVSLAVMS